MILHTLFQNIALAISAYSDELYTNARKLNSTGIVGNDARISTDGESLIGQIRWYKPLTANINVPSLTNSAEGNYTDVATDVATFIKAARTFGAQQVNLQNLVSKQDGLQKIARDFMEVRSQDEHDNILATLKGVAAAEVARGGGTFGRRGLLHAEQEGLVVRVDPVLGEGGEARHLNPRARRPRGSPRPRTAGRRRSGR